MESSFANVSAVDRVIATGDTIVIAGATHINL